MQPQKVLFLIRHGESVYNKWRRESFTRLRFSDMLTYDAGKRDVDLSPDGTLATYDKQAKYLETLQLASVRTVLTSPLYRALQTADILFNAPPQSDSSLWSSPQTTTFSSDTDGVRGRRLNVVSLFDLSEWVKTSADVATPTLNTLQESFPSVDFSDLFLLHGTSNGGRRRTTSTLTASNSDEKRQANMSHWDEAWRLYRPDSLGFWERCFRKVPSEPFVSLQRRVENVRRYICSNTTDNAMCIVGHAYYIRELTGDTKMRNLEMRKYWVDVQTGKFTRDWNFST
eukprot:GHVQ01018920.1.p1 GENE.GHVQ01018920.1~~GHVQ01018920.1.p1  ORF type:complete len:285 (-),score=25.47 GHVQ01018920.1:742-1596(-)